MKKKSAPISTNTEDLQPSNAFKKLTRGVEILEGHLISHTRNVTSTFSNFIRLLKGKKLTAHVRQTYKNLKYKW